MCHEAKINSGILVFGFVQSLNSYSFFICIGHGSFFALFSVCGLCCRYSADDVPIAKVKSFIDSHFKINWVP